MEAADRLSLIWVVIVALVRAAMLLAALGVLLLGRQRKRPGWVVVGIAIVGLGLALVRLWPPGEIPYDFKRFWEVGRDLNRGIDYYALPADHGRDPILNPPTVLPLFRLLAWMPMPTASAWWNGVNVLAALALVPLARVAVRSRESSAGDPDWVTSVVAVAVAISCATGMGLALGQISLLATLAIALAVRGGGRPIRYGLWLAVATIKVHTVLPFLLLFARRGERRTWISLAAGSLLLCSLGGPLTDLPRRCARTLAVIGRTHEPGQVNDYTEAGPSHASLVGLDHLVYRVGLSGDRRVLGAARLAILAVGGIGLAWLVVGRRVDREAGLALVGLYASLFLYHRLYDELVLVIPLAIALERSRNRGAAGRAWSVAGASCLLVLFVDPEGLLIVERWAGGGEAGVVGALARATILPLATWLILLAMAAVAWGLRIEARTRAGISVGSRSRGTHVRRSVEVSGLRER